MNPQTCIHATGVRASEADYRVCQRLPIAATYSSPFVVDLYDAPLAFSSVALS